jgi:citrate lyase beta subunit
MTGEKRDPQIARTWGDAARAALEAYGSAADLALELGVPARNAATVGALTVAKLEREPVEDLRIDFEDGFTQRGVPLEDRDADEDARATEAADILADWLDADADGGHPRHAPAFAGIRFRSFDPAVRDRGLRTLVIVLSRLARRGVLNKVLANDPRALRLTLPKVQHHSQVETFVEILEQLEETFGVPETTRIPFEVQVETPQAIVGVRGEAEPARILAAGRGRILSLHYGTYDYSASLGVDATEQSMEHPVADHAKDVLQVATTAVGVELSDGSTNRIPVGSPAQILDGWRIHHRLVTRHLRRAVRQGWDLHAHQLVTRHLATIAYFRASWEVSAERLRDYVAGDTSRWLDEPATAKAMAGYLLRARECGAVTPGELAVTGVDAGGLRRLQVSGRL